MSNPIDYKRSRRRYSSKRFTLDSEDHELDIQTTYSMFDGVYQGARYKGTTGEGDGTRFNIRIKPESNPILVQYNSTDNDIIYIAGDEIFEDFTAQVQNLYITPADATTAQVETMTAVAESSGNYETDGVGEYFKLYAQNGVTFETTVYGIWFNTDAGSTQPTDTEVDTWVPVPISGSDTAETVAAAMETAIDAISGTPFAADDAGTPVVTITHSVSGSRANAVNVNSPLTSFSTTTEGAGQDTVVNIKVI